MSLITLESRLEQFSLTNQLQGISNISEDFKKLVVELREKTMSLRMIPLYEMFNSLNRTFRDTTNKLNKKVEF